MFFYARAVCVRNGALNNTDFRFKTAIVREASQQEFSQPTSADFRFVFDR